MKRLLSTLALMLAAQSATSAQPALVLYNATVYTVNDAQPHAQAVIAENGRILFVGSSAEALKRAPRQAKRIDLKGRALFPGFTDSHVHLAGIGYEELEFNLRGTTGIDDLKRRLRDRVRQTKPGDWIRGRGWIESQWTPVRFPTRQDLDEVAPDRAVVLRRSDGHSLVANSLALRRAGIDRTSANPAGGEILKDERGEPTGMLIDNAADIMLDRIPDRTDDDIQEALEAGIAREIRLGWTQLQIAGNTYREVDLIRRLCGQGKLKLRIYDAIQGPGPDADRLLASGPSLNECRGRLDIRGIKFYIDGALGSRGAALLKPYTDSPNSSGLLISQEADLYPVVVRALRQGIQVETHAIGDRGNRIMLDLYEKAFQEVPPANRAVANPRFRIEHAQILDPSDIPRFGKLGVIASMQPSHAIGDMFFAPKRLGPDRLSGAYAWKSLLDTGAIVVGGSDAPAERGEPMIEFYAAVVRKSLDGFSDDNWHHEQRVSREQALKMFTLWPAYAAFQEKDKGSIEVGKRADYTVLSADIMRIPETDLLKTHAVMTVVDGEIVYSTP